MPNYKPKLLILIIILIGSLFRFNNLNWDDGHHLHPDERFLTMVNNDTKLPTNFKEYTNTLISPLNPRNANKNFFVYGNWPLIINKLIAVILDNNDYHNLTIQGRFISALMDTLVILIIYLICSELEERYKFNSQIKYLASFSYSLMVLPIQLSHFYTNDTFLNFFCLTSLYFSILYKFKQKKLAFLLSAVTLGMGIASKISALYMIPLIIFFITDPWLLVKPYINKEKNNTIKKTLYQTLTKTLKLILFFILSYLTLKLTDPYLFRSPNLLKPQIDYRFLANIKELTSWQGKTVWFPPAVQWLTKKPTFAIQNIIFFGVGIIPSIFFFIGLTSLSKYLINKWQKSIYLWAIILWLLSYLGYQSIQFVKSMRYFIIIYPLLAIIIGHGINYFLYIKIFKQKFGINKRKFIILTLMLIWPLTFSSIYVNPHSRVKASYWIYNNIPKNSNIINEAWDDALPLTIKGNSFNDYQHTQVHPYNKDESQKWEELRKTLLEADYYVLSSNRAFGSIPTAPHQYPVMGQFYEKLLNGELNYEIVAEINSYPSLEYLGIPLTIPDYMAEEAFSVYDHPRVIILKNKDRD